MADVFMSYARSDKASGRAAGRRDPGEWLVGVVGPGDRPGQEFDRQIAAELKAAAAVLVVWTPVRWSRAGCAAKRGTAADRGILVPVHFDGASLPIDVRALHTTDMDGWRGDPGSPQGQEIVARTERHV